MPVFSCVGGGGEGMPVFSFVCGGVCQFPPFFEYMLRFEGAVVVAGEQFDWPRLLGQKRGLQGAGPARGPIPDLGRGPDPQKTRIRAILRLF